MSVSVTFRLVYVQIIFSSVYIAEWPPFFERAAHSVDRAFVFGSRFGSEGRIWALISPVHDHCLLFTLKREELPKIETSYTCR